MFQLLCGHFQSIILTLLHSERPKLYTILAFLSAVGLKGDLKENKIRLEQP